MTSNSQIISVWFQIVLVKNKVMVTEASAGNSLGFSGGTRRIASHVGGAELLKAEGTAGDAWHTGMAAIQRCQW